jgi:hypothetical protein
VDSLDPAGCQALSFDPTIEAKPTTNLTDSPSGLDIRLEVPQNEDPEGLATAHLRKAVVALPDGLTVNAASADGLGSCAPQQIGLGTDDPVSCPDASKIGSVEIDTPLLGEPLTGGVYLAKQGDNPFGSLLALYIVAKGPGGLVLKLPGEVTTDPVSGRLIASFDQNPQLPFEALEVHLKQGPRAPLKTPAACGVYTTTTDLTPWSSPEGADAFPSDSFELTQGPSGGGCLPTGGQAPNKPSFSGGTIDPTAGVYTPFVLKLARADGSQQIKAIDTTLPQGLLGKLAGIPYCPDDALAAAAAGSGRSEQGSPSCSSASQVGSVNVGAGAGSTPLYVNAKAYLSSPFQVGECSKLGFKPKLGIRLKGGTKRGRFPALTATLTARPGDANIGAAVVSLPHSEFLAQEHLKTICTRVQYAANACPPGSIYGSARAFSPLLDKPLEGPVYLRSSNNSLPDMVVALAGQIDVDLVGRIDSFNKGIRTSFEAVPDAPVSKFVLSMKGGKKGLLVNSRNLCKSVNKASVKMEAQNGAAYDSQPLLKSSCRKAKAKKRGKRG